MTQTRKQSTNVQNDIKHVNTEPTSSKSTPNLKTEASQSVVAPSTSQISSKSQELHKKIESLSSKIEEANRKSDILVSEVTSTTSSSVKGNEVESPDADNDVGESNTNTPVTSDNSKSEETDDLRKRRLQHFSTSSPVKE